MATERQIAANRTNEKKHRCQNCGGQVEGEPQRLRRRQKPMPSRTSWPASRPATRSGWRQPRWRRAQPDLQRIRAERAELLAELDLTSGDVYSLRRLAAFRYERLAHTMRRRASRKL